MKDDGCFFGLVAKKAFLKQTWQACAERSANGVPQPVQRLVFKTQLVSKLNTAVMGTVPPAVSPGATRGVCPCSCACKAPDCLREVRGQEGNGGHRRCSFWQDKRVAPVVTMDLSSPVSEMLVPPPDPPTAAPCVRALAERLRQTNPRVSPLPGRSAGHGAVGVDAMEGLKMPHSHPGCSCQSVGSSERLSPARWDQSSQQDERFLQREGLWGNSLALGALLKST